MDLTLLPKAFPSRQLLSSPELHTELCLAKAGNFSRSCIHSATAASLLNAGPGTPGHTWVPLDLEDSEAVGRNQGVAAAGKDLAETPWV